MTDPAPRPPPKRSPKRPNTIRAVLEGHDEVGCDYCDNPLCPAACEGYDPYTDWPEDW